MAHSTHPKARSVILLHDSPQLGPHYDWLFGDPRAPDAPRLATLRLTSLPAFDGTEQIDAAMLGPHRAAYLDYEGPVSGGRGTVSRVWAGEVERLSVAPDSLDAMVVWNGHRASVVAAPAAVPAVPGLFDWVAEVRRVDT